VAGVALNVSTTTYNFISSMKGAPRTIKTLAAYIETLRSFLESSHETTSHDLQCYQKSYRCRDTTIV